jgi:hypothetical protein
MARLAVIPRVTVPKYEILDARLLSVGHEGKEICTKECLDLLRICTELVCHKRLWLGFGSGTVEFLGELKCKPGSSLPVSI